MADEDDVGKLGRLDGVCDVLDVGLDRDLARQEVAALAHAGLGGRVDGVTEAAQAGGDVAPDPAAAVGTVDEDVGLGGGTGCGLIELVLRLQRPEKSSRTSSKPPATDRKERREQAKPGWAKPGHEGHSRAISDDPDAVVDHRPDRCACCGGPLHGDLPAEVVSIAERIELPEVAPTVTQHRRLAVRCPSCGARVAAPVPEAARGTPFGPSSSA